MDSRTFGWEGATNMRVAGNGQMELFQLDTNSCWEEQKHIPSKLDAYCITGVPLSEPTKLNWMANNSQNPPLGAATNEIGTTIETPGYESYDVETSYFLDDHR